uniref:Uncharacterized protein n=1 Tax=Oryza nivara TaxID=4536 RepID=A0A0E0GLV2_ORYNI
METTRRSSTPAVRRNSCLLWRTWVMAAAVGLPMAATPPDAAAMAVRPSTERTAVAVVPASGLNGERVDEGAASFVIRDTGVVDDEQHDAVLGLEGPGVGVPAARTRCCRPWPAPPWRAWHAARRPGRRQAWRGTPRWSKKKEEKKERGKRDDVYHADMWGPRETHADSAAT